MRDVLTKAELNEALVVSTCRLTIIFAAMVAAWVSILATIILFVR